MTGGKDEAKIFRGHKGWVNSIKALDDRLYSGSEDMTIIIWDIETAEAIDKLEGHKSSVTSIDFCNGMLFSASYDNLIIEWNLTEI